MFHPCHKRLRLIALLLFSMVSYAIAGPNHSLGFAGKRADSISDKTVEKQQWTNRASSDLMEKSFPIQEWDKHYSSLGSKRSLINPSKTKDKAIFKTKTKEFERKELEIFRWNEKMKDLHKDAQLIKDAGDIDKASDQQTYQMLLQDAQPYEDLAEELSLRDINKFQFRRNHSDGAVPVQPAGVAN